MKKNILIILFIFYSTIAYSQNNQKHYFIDVDLIIKDDKDFLSTKARIEQQMNNDLEDLKKIKEKFIKDNKPELTMDALKPMQQTNYDKHLLELDDQANTIKFYYKKREEELRLPIIKKILKRISEFGEKNNYLLILEKRSIILYNKSALVDITPEFINSITPKN